MPASDPDPCLHRLLAGQGDLTDFPRADFPFDPRPVGEIKIDQTKGGPFRVDKAIRPWYPNLDGREG